MSGLPEVDTPRIPEASTYHGVEVEEDYRWLEDAQSEQTVRWTDAQQRRTRDYLDALPWRGVLRARAEQLLRDDSTSYYALASGGEVYFALVDQKPRQRPFLVVLTDLHE